MSKISEETFNKYDKMAYGEKMNKLVKKYKEIDYHRNGIGGEGFHAIVFENTDGQRMVGITFNQGDTANGILTAVLDIDLLNQENIRFGENSWRGDNYHEELQEIVKEYKSEKEKELTADFGIGDMIDFFSSGDDSINVVVFDEKGARQVNKK